MVYDSDVQSTYCYKGTTILINNYDIRDQEVLDRIEADLTRKNLVMMNLEPVKGSFDLKHLQKIHMMIFGDLYPFAGKIRTEKISKGHTTFAFPEYINSYAQIIFKELKDEKFLLGKPFGELAERLAYYMAEINLLHPFREGNGRATREFIRLLALKNNFEVKWENVSKNELLQACITSVTHITPLMEIMKRITAEPHKE